MSETKDWKRSKFTTGLVGRIRTALRADGYEEECGVVPLAKLFSVVARKGEEFFNVRMDKQTLAIVGVDSIEYKLKGNRIRRVFRKPVNG